jgi:hypothetical protein
LTQQERDCLTPALGGDQDARIQNRSHREASRGSLWL